MEQSKSVHDQGWEGEKQQQEKTKTHAAYLLRELLSATLNTTSTAKTRNAL